MQFTDQYLNIYIRQYLQNHVLQKNILESFVQNVFPKILYIH